MANDRFSPTRQTLPTGLHIARLTIAQTHQQQGLGRHRRGDPTPTPAAAGADPDDLNCEHKDTPFYLGTAADRQAQLTAILDHRREISRRRQPCAVTEL